MNIMISRADGVAKILDFGISRLTASEQRDITKTGEVLGTAGFMSPEQLRGERSITPRSDLYCLGAIMFELLEGRPPFVGDSALQISMAHLLAPVPLQTRPDTPPYIRALVEQLLAKAPADRPMSAESVLRIIERRRTPRVVEPGSRSRPVLVVATIATLIALAIVIRWMTDEPAPARRPAATIRQAVPAPAVPRLSLSLLRSLRNPVDAPLISCHLDTGQKHWPGYRYLMGSRMKTSGPIAFDYHAEIWKFLAPLAQMAPGQ